MAGIRFREQGEESKSEVSRRESEINKVRECSVWEKRHITE